MNKKTRNTAKRSKVRAATLPVSESAHPTPACKILFSPKGGISKELSRLTQAAAKEISVAAYAFSSKYLGNALVSAMKRGVKVRLILDKDNAEKAYSIDEWLIENGIDVRFIKLKSGCMHHKFLIVDRARLMTGSYNFTNDSEFRNHEAAIFIDAAVAAPTTSPGATATATTTAATATAAAVLVNAFAAEFDRIWTIAAPPTISGGKG